MLKEFFYVLFLNFIIMNVNWNLNVVFTSKAEAKKALAEVMHQVKDFKVFYEYRLASLSAAAIDIVLKRYIELLIGAGRVNDYAYLLHSTNLNNNSVSTFYQNVCDQISLFDKQLVFFVNWLKTGENINLDELKSVLPTGTFVWLKQLRRFKKHTVDAKIQQLFEEENSVNQYWIRLYDETRAAMTFKIKGQRLSEGDALALMSSGDAKLRKEAGKALSKEYAKKRPTFALIYNALLRCQQIDTQWHNYSYPEEPSVLENNIENEDLDNLVNTVLSNNTVPQRYYTLKAKAFGVKQISYWDRNAPYPFSADVKEENYTIEQAKDLVLEAFNAFSPEFASIAQRFFDEDLIDYCPYKGKDSGAYCMEMAGDAMPMVFLNFTGSTGSVITMAHELGHAVHEYLSKQQGELGRRKACAQAETASIFAEQLVFNLLLKKAKTPKERFCLLAEHLEDMISTAYRQIAFHCFESCAAAKRLNGEISTVKLEKLWLSSMKGYLGESVDISNLAPMWAGILHFFQYPFYVYSYCFACCVVNTLYEIYQKGTVDNFAEKYMQMLRNGGVENYREALAHFGVDASKSDFWQKGLTLGAEHLSALEQLYEQISKEE